MKIGINPSITINNITYRGDRTGFDLFKAICAGFKNLPEVCKGNNVNDELRKENIEYL